jgi:hypothetical protein
MQFLMEAFLREGAVISIKIESKKYGVGVPPIHSLSAIECLINLVGESERQLYLS